MQSILGQNLCQHDNVYLLLIRNFANAQPGFLSIFTEAAALVVSMVATPLYTVKQSI